METRKIKKISNSLDNKNIYILEKSESKISYDERVSRNIGWLSEKEQKKLKESTVGIAGCGGMGGLTAITMLRLGVGKIKIADNDVFEPSNLNRQYASNQKTIGYSKAFSTAKEMRKISSDVDIHIFPMGINKESLSYFVEGCDIIIDEIEFWALGSRLLLHEEAKRKNIDIINCNTVGFQTNLFLFDNKNKSLLSYLKLDLGELLSYEERKDLNTISDNDIKYYFDLIRTSLVPEVPSYGRIDDTKIENLVISKLLKTGNASIVSTNPIFSCGFLCNQVLLRLIKGISPQRELPSLPSFPDYIVIDSVNFLLKTVKRKEA